MTNRVKIKITGKHPTTFLKELIEKKINIYQLEKKEDSLMIIISMEDYKKIKEKKTIYQLKIIKYYGISRIKYLIKKYWILILLWIIGIGLNYILSTRIWKIEIVNSNQKIIKLVRKDLEKYGIKVLKRKKTYQEREKIKKIIEQTEKNDIEWLEIEEKGSKYIIKVEQRKKNKQEKQCLPRNIVAKKSAIITDIHAEDGEVISKKNEYVSKGQVIISGWIHNKEEVVSKKCAKGVIYGETWYRVTVQIPKVKEKQLLTNRRKKVISLIIGNQEYSFPQKYRSYQKKEYNIIEEKIIPIKLSIINYQETRKKKKKYTSKEINQMALKKANKSIQKKLKSGEKVLEKKVLKKTQINSKIEVEIFIKVKENITSYEDISKIEIEKENEAKE